MTLDDTTALRLGTAILREQIASVDAAFYDRPSVCDGWTVRELMSHVIGGAQRYILLMADATEADLAATRTQDWVGEDPLRVLDDLEKRLAAAFAEPDAMSRIAHHRSGDVNGAELLAMRVMEQTLHAWDIAESLHTAIELPEALCAYILENFTAYEQWRAEGAFGDANAPADDSARARLLSASGRG